jgi:hypothetical protein
LLLVAFLSANRNLVFKLQVSRRLSAGSLAVLPKMKKRSMTKDEIGESLLEVIASVENKIASIGEVEQSSKAVYLISYFLTVLHYSKSIANSIKSDNLISVAPILRTQLEAFVELINLTKYENYSKVLYAIHIEQKIKMIEATFKDTSNPFFKDTIDKMKNRGENIKFRRNELKKVKSEISDFDGNYRQIKTRFKYAGLEEVYTSVYSILCQDTHNDLLSIENRHFHSDNGKLTILTKINWPINEVDSHILTSLALIESSVENVFPCLGYEKPVETLNLIEEKHKILDSYFMQMYR